MNSKMTSLDWKWLTAIAGGQTETAPKLQRDKLLALNFIIARHRKDSFALTGLGSDALLRRKYKLGLPEAEPSVAPQPVAVADEVEGLEPSEATA